MRDILNEGRKSNSGLYRETKILMAYASAKIDGERVSKEEISDDYPLFDLMLDTVDEPITIDLIKRYHRCFGDGEYRKTVSTMDKVTGYFPPSEIPAAIEKLCKTELITFNDICDFVAKFEKIKPFEFHSGDIARVIAYKECLRMEKKPVVAIVGNKQSAYILGLAVYDENPEKFHKAMQKYRSDYMAIVRKYI